jgi:small subunit ribosomal protein S1
VHGKVVGVTDYGAFVEIEPGVEGLVHISEMSWSKRMKHPSKIVKVGEEVEVQVLDVKPEQRRISLGIKQTQPDPWNALQGKYPVGSTVSGKVRNLTDFGAFVELEPGVDGLLHISQMSNRPVGRPEEIVNVGDELTLLVIRVDPNERRIGLSLKELAHAVPPPDVVEDASRGGGRKRKGKQRADYDYDEED